MYHLSISGSAETVLFCLLLHFDFELDFSDSLIMGVSARSVDTRNIVSARCKAASEVDTFVLLVFASNHDVSC